MKIGIVGTEHMAESLIPCLKKFGNKIVPLKDCEVCWIAIDTPVDKNGLGIIKPILDAVKIVKYQLKDGTLIIISSQIPVGTSQEIIKILGKKFLYAYMPETMRVGFGPLDFMNLPEIPIGVNDNETKIVILKIFKKKPVHFTSVATAEMIKHATNAFLATSLSFIYDIADLCEAVGADVTDVARALRADYRIGQEAYLDASVGFSGGHLERDLSYLQEVAKAKKVKIPVLSGVIKKNLKRRRIVIDKLGDIKDKKVAFWGITYKQGVPPSKSSLPAKLMRDLKRRGAEISIYDKLYAKTNPYDSVKNCIAIVCITPWEELKEINFRKVAKLMAKPKIFFDARNYLKNYEVAIKKAGIKYTGIGR